MDFIDMQYGIFGDSDCCLIFIRCGEDGGVAQSFILVIKKRKREQNPSVTFRHQDCSCSHTFVAWKKSRKEYEKIREKKKKKIFSRFFSSLWKWGRNMTHHPSHSQPFSEMFHASLSTDWKIRVTSCPPALREMIVALWAKLPQSIEWMCQWSIPH